MDPNWTFNGLPLHPLLVHAVVILIPLTAVALLLAVFWPAARRRLGIVVPIAGLLLVVLVPITVQAGEALKEVVGPIPAVIEHESYGQMVLPWVIALAVVAIGEWVWYRFFDERMKTGSPGARPRSAHRDRGRGGHRRRRIDRHRRPRPARPAPEPSGADCSRALTGGRRAVPDYRRSPVSAIEPMIRAACRMRASGRRSRPIRSPR